MGLKKQSLNFSLKLAEEVPHSSPCIRSYLCNKIVPFNYNKADAKY